jgi:hypothetical protein
MTSPPLPGPEPAVPDSDEKADALVGSLVTVGVDLSLEGDDVVFSGPAYALGQETIAALRENKRAVVSLLQRNRTRGVLKLGPTSREQRRMEWRNRTDRNPATYNVCLRFELRGVINPQLLARVVTALAGRHEILRTRFSWYGEHLLQEIMSPPRSVLQILHPTTLSDASEQEVADWCSRRGAAAFDLGAEAPARWCYAQRGPDRAVLLITFHHIACDGWSIERLLREFQTLCCAEARLVEVAVPPVTITPREFARWETNWLTDERVESARTFWVEELRGAVLAPALTRARVGAALGGDASCVVRTFTPAVTARVTAATHSLAMSEFSFYFAAFAMLLREETDGRDCAVVIAVLNRTRPEHEELMGLSRNALPIRCSAKEGDTIDVVARRISERVERALGYQWFPIGLIDPPDGTQETADPRRLPITFGFEGPSESILHCNGFSATMHDVFLGAARAEFSLLVRHREDAAEAFFEYSKSWLCAEDVGLLADRYVSIVTDEVGRLIPSQS